MKQVFKYTLVLGLALSLSVAFAAVASAKGPAPKGTSAIVYSGKGKNFLTAVVPMNVDGNVNVVVESPAGTTKLNKADAKGDIITIGKVKYLPAPFNMGVVPGTLCDDGPLQAIVLADAAPIGSIVKGLAIGVINYKEQGKDVKAVLVVGQNSAFAEVGSLEALKKQFPGAAEMITAWFANAYGEVESMNSRLDALHLVGDSILAHANATIKESDRRPMDKEGNPTLLNYPKSKNIRVE